MLNFGLPSDFDANRSLDGRARLCAVSYLNTVPLVWGMLEGEQRGLFHLNFRLPAECADLLAARRVDAGLVPVAEIPRLGLHAIPGTGIACDGPVRSILLISKAEPSGIRTLAADISSRTSVMLARILLSRAFDVEPELFPATPDLPSMLARADAALIIGDPALQLDPQHLPYHAIDLGSEWKRLTGLPMVFAVWAGPDAALNQAIAPALAASRDYGLARIREIIKKTSAGHGISEDLAHEYLTRHIIFKLRDREMQGLKLFQQYAADLRAQDERKRVTA